MDNTITDRLQLVEKKSWKMLPLIRLALLVIPGEAQEIFRGETYLGSVSPDSSNRSPIKVGNGDVIYRVKLLPQPYDCVGSFITKDEYTRMYHVTLVLQVTDSYLLVQRYQQPFDPVKWVINRFQTLLQQHAAQLEHDRITSETLPLERWNDKFSSGVGIKITQTENFVLRDDPKRTKEVQLEEETKMKMASIKAQADIRGLEDRLARKLETEQKEHMRLEQWKQKNFGREEGTRQHMHQLHISLRETAAEELKMILRDRIREAYERGGRISEVAEESMKLLNAFQASLQRGGIVDGFAFTNDLEMDSWSVSSDAHVMGKEIEDLPSMSHGYRKTPTSAQQNGQAPAQEGAG